MPEKILVIEDERGILELLTMNLELLGYEVRTADTGVSAIAQVTMFEPDLILLDRMLPDTDGLTICEMLRKNSATQSVPIIILSARGEESDIVRGLTAGADDYVTKPFRIQELEARIQSLLRRRTVLNPSDPSAAPEDARLSFGPLTLDPEAFSCTVDGKEVDLTLSEFKIMERMISRPNKVVSREELFRVIALPVKSADLRTIDVHIRNIRRKLEPLGADCIKTVRGIGYKIGS